jgi:hypothetical protein
MKVEDLIADFNNQLQKANEDVNQLEADFADMKLNPYGVTKVDFTRRNQIREQILRLEGAIEGLTLAKAHCEELGGTWGEPTQDVQDDLS